MKPAQRDTSRTAICEFCGKAFHPWRRSAARFCSNACHGRMQSVEARASRAAATILNDTPRRRAEIARECLVEYERLVAS